MLQIKPSDQRLAMYFVSNNFDDPFTEWKWAMSREKDLSFAWPTILQTRMCSHLVESDPCLPLVPFIMCSNSEGSNETAQMRTLAWTMRYVPF